MLMHVNLTDYHDQFVNGLVTSDASPVPARSCGLRLRLLEKEAREEDEKLALLRSMASEAFQELDRGEGIVFDGEQELAGFIGQVSNH